MGKANGKIKESSGMTTAAESINSPNCHNFCIIDFMRNLFYNKRRAPLMAPVLPSCGVITKKSHPLIQTMLFVRYFPSDKDGFLITFSILISGWCQKSKIS